MKIKKEFQSLLFSSQVDIQAIKSFIKEHQNALSPAQIDHQIILAFSFNYEKIPIFAPLLSKPEFF